MKNKYENGKKQIAKTLAGKWNMVFHDNLFLVNDSNKKHLRSGWIGWSFGSPNLIDDYFALIKETQTRIETSAGDKRSLLEYSAHQCQTKINFSKIPPIKEILNSTEGN